MNEGLLPTGNETVAKLRQLVEKDMRSTYDTLRKQVGTSGEGALDPARQKLYEVASQAMALMPLKNE